MTPASLDARAPGAKVYFKAVQIDGYSFQGSPKVLYEVGVTVVPAPQRETSGAPRICGPGYLHASNAAGETLIGGSWPCRLFEVTGTPVAGFDGEHTHKGGFLSLTIEREIEAHRALGPNGAQVVAFIERLKTTTEDDWTVVIRERQRASGDAARAAARAAAGAAAGAAAWAAARAAAGDAAGDAARAAARAAAWAAALALVARDKLSLEQFAVLYKPFATVIPADSLLAETQPEVTK